MLAEFGDKTRWLDLSILLKISWVKEETIFVKLETFLCYSQREFCSEALKKKCLFRKFSKVSFFSSILTVV